MASIETRGLDLLSKEEKAKTKMILNEYYSKIKRLIKNDLTLKIDLKEYKKDGKGKKYSISAEAFLPGKIFNSEAWSWDLERAIHKAMKMIETEIEHKYHVSEQHE